MLIKPYTLALITTHQCTAACDHCCFFCTPKVTKSIPIPRLFGLIDEAKSIPSIKLVVFTGGECFLLGKNLDELISYANNQGFMTRCVTNGYWATSESVAAKKVERLVAAGLREINFSTGTFHSEYVPIERVIYGSIYCAEAGITTLVNAEIFEGSSFPIEQIQKHSKLSKLIKEKKVVLQRNIWMPNAGLVQLNHKKESSRFNEQNKSGCTSALKVIAITPDQNLVACCGLTLEQIPDLHLGSIASATIQDVLQKTPDDLLKIWIHIEGPERILDFVKSKVKDYRLPIESVHPCQTCLVLYKDELAKDILRKHYQEVEDKVVSTYLAGFAGQVIGQKLQDIYKSGAE